MRVLALDLSSKTGWALFDSGSSRRNGYVAGDTVASDKTVAEFGKYPWSYPAAAIAMAAAVGEIVKSWRPDKIVIEETNLGQNRYTQKYLEFLHLEVLRLIADLYWKPDVYYVSSATWRKKLALFLTKEERKLNDKLSKAKSAAKKAGTKLDKKKLGIAGRINKKHLAVRYANEVYGLDLKMKNNDLADAICLGTAFLQGVPVCDGQGGEYTP